MADQKTSTSLSAHETFPIPTSTSSFWRTELHPLDTYRSSDDLPAASDIVIIGAGMTGVSVAYHLLKNVSPEDAPSITILEARQICSGATGRNGGHLKLPSWFPKRAAERWGVDTAKELLRYRLAHIDALKEVVEEETLDCDFLLTRSFDIFMDPGEARQREADVRTDKNMGIEAIREVDVIAHKYLEAVSNVKLESPFRSRLTRGTDHRCQRLSKRIQRPRRAVVAL